MSKTNTVAAPAALTAEDQIQTRMSRDLAKASATLNAQEARYLVDLYYIYQEDRKRNANQELALGTSGEPHSVIAFFTKQNTTLEAQVKRVLDKYTDEHPVGKWLKEIYGIGPVIAAGLLAHIDISQCPTAGHIWRYAGLDPTSEWIGREKAEKLAKEIEEQRGKLTPQELMLAMCSHTNRNPGRTEENLMEDCDGTLIRTKVIAYFAKRPWNASLKTLCWKVGQSFMKFSNNEDCVYGQLYRQRKEYETHRSESGQMAEYAASRVSKVGTQTEAYKAYAAGKLPPGQIDARARRWAVKIFLSHLHQVWYEYHFGKPAPAPYPIAIQGHAHKIEPRQLKVA